MITAVVGPDEFNSLNILEQKLPVAEMGVIAFANTCKWWPMFADTVVTYCNRNRVSFVCFHAHWDRGGLADKAAVANIVTVADRLVAFLKSGDSAVIKVVAEFKKVGKPVQIIRVGAKE